MFSRTFKLILPTGKVQSYDSDYHHVFKPHNVARHLRQENYTMLKRVRMLYTVAVGRHILILDTFGV